MTEPINSPDDPWLAATQEEFLPINWKTRHSGVQVFSDFDSGEEERDLVHFGIGEDPHTEILDREITAPSPKALTRRTNSASLWSGSSSSIYIQYFPGLWNIAKEETHYNAPFDDRHDHIQESLLQLWKVKEKGNPHVPFLVFARKVIRNHMIRINERHRIGDRNYRSLETLGDKILEVQAR
jgi:hypothetical protein